MTTVDLRGNWEAPPSGGPESYATCPRDPIPEYAPPAYCRAFSPIYGWLCTRPAGHTARHAASTGRYFVAVWL